MIDIDNKLNEECGVFGVYNVSEASELAYYGLHALQHRGQEGCGIVTSDTNELHRFKGLGLVQDVFNEEILTDLVGTSAIGHVRYSTSGGNTIENVQPFIFHNNDSFALCHNGNIVNAKELKMKLENEGTLFHSTSDTEIFAHLVRQNRSENRIDAIKTSLSKLYGAFAFLILTNDKLYAMRDKWGLRPLSIAKLNGGYIVSSETCAFDLIGAEYIRDLKAGEIVVISENGIESYMYDEFSDYHVCAMEYIYFSRPDTNIEKINVHATRKLAGKILAKNYPVDADLVVGVPDSSISAAIGYAEESGIPYEMALVKNKYVGRTFIQPSQELRERGVKLKLSAVSSLVKGKRVIMVDDSIVRGTTSRKIVELLKEAGASEVHVRIASPQIIAPCFYGVDTSTYEELISARFSLEQIKNEIKATSLQFLTTDEIKEAVKTSTEYQCGLCMACFNKNYPTKLFDNIESANK